MLANLTSRSKCLPAVNFPSVFKRIAIFPVDGLASLIVLWLDSILSTTPTFSYYIKL
jgi:hypothetical protein